MTIEYYNQFNDNFPESNYKVEVDKIFDITKTTIDQLKLTKDEI